MNRLLAFAIILLVSACEQKNEKTISIKPDPELSKPRSKAEKEKKLHFTNGPSREKLELNNESIIIIKLDSSEIEQLKKIKGDEDFYTGADDLMWYHSLLLEKMDSLKVPVRHTSKDTVELYATNYNQTIIKDSTFSIYTYFHFDGNKLIRKELYHLLED